VIKLLSSEWSRFRRLPGQLSGQKLFRTFEPVAAPIRAPAPAQPRVSARSRAPRALSLPLWPLAHIQENAALHNAVLKHVVVLLVPADRRAFEDQTGPSHEGQCFWVAPRMAVTLSAKRLYRKDRDPQPRQSMQPKG
jgi:hypothetical protein